MLCKATVRARPSVLWCFKTELGFSSHRKKRMKQLQKKIDRGQLDVDEDNPFEMFVAATSIRLVAKQTRGGRWRGEAIA